MSANRTNGALKPTLMQRPPLPVGHANPLIATRPSFSFVSHQETDRISAFPYFFAVDPVKIPPVKFQEIVREGQTTVVCYLVVDSLLVLLTRTPGCASEDPYGTRLIN